MKVVDNLPMGNREGVWIERIDNSRPGHINWTLPIGCAAPVASVAGTGALAKARTLRRIKAWRIIDRSLSGHGLTPPWA